MQLFYSQLAAWWPLISPVEEYREEAHEFMRVLEAVHPAARTVLELGCGGGHNASYLKARYALTLTDLSAEMLQVSQQLNPECEHFVGDMRTLQLARQFDVVFAQDALDYMTTPSDLRAAIATAYGHCKPGGVVLFVPDAVVGRFEPDTAAGGSDAADGRGVRYLEWSYDLDPHDQLATAHYVFVVRQADGSTQSYDEVHHVGLFTPETWVELMTEQGFATEVHEERTLDERVPRLLFVGRRL